MTLRFHLLVYVFWVSYATSVCYGKGLSIRLWLLELDGLPAEAVAGANTIRPGYVV